MKVIDGGDNKISAIGKDLIESHCLGEFIGVAKLSKDFTQLFSVYLKIIMCMMKIMNLKAAIQLI